MQVLTRNYCEGCIGRSECNCCSNFFIVLNPSEMELFKQHSKFFEVEGGGILYNASDCPYFKGNNCQIHDLKPLYCRYYPIFITGEPYVDENCPIHDNYQLTSEVEKEITALQHCYPIYQLEWLWKDVKQKFNLDEDEG